MSTTFGIQTSTTPLDLLYNVSNEIERQNWFRPGSYGKVTLSNEDPHFDNLDNYMGGQDFVYVGDIQFMAQAFRGLQIKHEPWAAILPEKMVRRKMVATTLGDIVSCQADEFKGASVFFKPQYPKLFEAQLFTGGSALELPEPFPEDTPILVSEYTPFLCEFRAFIKNGSVIDIRPYSGDWWNHMGGLSHVKPTLQEWMRLLPEQPMAFCIDFGVMSDKFQTLAVVELTDMWSLGCYGFEGPDLLTMLSQRFHEIRRNKTTAVKGF